MTSKCHKSYHTTQPKASTKSMKITLQDLLYEPLDKDEDGIVIPNSLPGQHFHCDFGFMRSKEYKFKDEDGKLQTSIDGKNAYLLIIDRCTMYMWVFVSKSKEPPLDFCQKVLNKFKASTKHRTIRCDQGELASSNKFKNMIKEEGFTLEVTGSNNSKQNGMAERPHRTLAQMVRCVLHSSGLGPEYWSYALLHCVYMKNRLPHKSINKTPFEALTGNKPDLTNSRIFGSRVVAQIPRSRTGKLDSNNVAQGIFVGFTGTDKNVWYIDDHTKRPKIGSWVDFDEAHMSIPQQMAPLAAQALQRVGYHLQENMPTPYVPKGPVCFERLSSTAKSPTSLSHKQCYDLYCDVDPMIIPPGQTKLIQTGISLNAGETVLGEIKQNLNCHLSLKIKLFTGDIELNPNREIILIMHNMSKDEVSVTKDDNIARLHLPWSIKTAIPITTYKPKPTRCSERQRNNKRAAKLEATMQVSMDLPYDLQMSSDPYNNHTHRVIAINSRSPTLGMKIEQCPIRNLPILKSCLSGLPAAKIINWRKDLKNAYITQVNNNKVRSKADIIKEIENCKRAKLKEIEVRFSTLERQGIHPQHGVPQLYYDQRNIIAKHIFDIQHMSHTNLDDNKLQSTHQSTANTNKSMNITSKQQWKQFIHAVKRKHNTFTLSQLKKCDNWEEWNNSIFKQLDQYRDQSTFDDPEPLPPNANLLSLCWVYLIKTDGFNTKKARCVCNGSPRMRGTVTLAETYASALDQTGSKMFWATAAINNYVVLGADASNAFAKALPPKAPLYVRIDENYRRWFKARYPDKPAPPEDHVLRVRKALQGHLESPRLWAELIDRIIKNLNLKPCTHEKCLYFTENYNNTGKRVIFLRQVDDFAIACEDRATAKQVIQDINSKMTIDVKDLGVVSCFNGVDVLQTQEYIKLHNTTYINKIIQQHSWINDDNTPMPYHPLPMNPDTKYQHQLEQATPLEMDEKLKLERKLNFTYRQVVGEIIYAMIICRPNISYAIIKLSQYSN